MKEYYGRLRSGGCVNIPIDLRQELKLKQGLYFRIKYDKNYIYLELPQIQYGFDYYLEPIKQEKIELPAEHERWNRFYKYCMVGYSKDQNKQLDWDKTFKSNCEECKLQTTRDQLTLKQGRILCKKCLQQISNG